MKKKKIKVRSCSKIVKESFHGQSAQHKSSLLAVHLLGLVLLVGYS